MYLGGYTIVLKHLRIIILTICLFFLFTCVSIVSALDYKTVAKITRITHPAYTMSNIWQGEGFGGPWNKDYTRIMIYESMGDAYVNPTYGVQGRGFVWGYVSTLKNLGGGVNYQGSLADYQNNTYQLPTNYQEAPVWSIFSGEENVIYALKTTNKMLVKYNVDTHVETEITSYDRSGSSLTYPQIVGWTTDNNRLLVAFGGAASWSDGWEINVQTGAKTYFSSRPSYCSAEGWRWPWAKNIHAGRSLDKKYIAWYGERNGVFSNDYTTYCYPFQYGAYDNQYVDDGNVEGYNWTHIMWDISDDWYMAGDVGTFKSSSPQGAPYLTTYHIAQIFFDRTTHHFTHNVLLSMPGAGYWRKGGTIDYNYHGLPTPTVRKDGNQIMFMSTNGVYSVEDYEYNNSYTPYGARGMFLVDLSASANPPPSPSLDTTPPAPPTVIEIK
jgi:hypothetical protein